MTPIAVFAQAVAYFTAAALSLALVVGALMLAFEDLGLRRLINKRSINNWVKNHAGQDVRGQVGLSYTTYALPYKQVVGLISSLVQANVGHSQLTGIAQIFVMIGEKLVNSPSPDLPMANSKEQVPPESSSLKSTRLDEQDQASRQLFYAERALDDLQAYLAQRWTIVRYIVAFYVSSFLAAVLAFQRDQDSTIGIFAPLVVNAIVMIVAVLFAPILRDVLEILTRRQR